MRFLTILVTTITFATSAFAGEQEDVSKCISAAKRYADISLRRSNYKYDGGWFSSDIIWYGDTPALCELDTDVNRLVINGQTYIVEGFSGAKARSMYQKNEAEFESIRRKSDALNEKYSRFLSVMKARLQKPKPDLDKIQSDLNTQVEEIKLRVLGTAAELGAAFNDDEVSKKLREKIQELEIENQEISNELKKVRAEQRESTPQDVLQLRDQLAKLEKSIASYRKTSEQKDDLNRKLEQQVEDLKKELLAFKTPIAPLIEEILFEINGEKFEQAYSGILSLRKLPLYDQKTNNVFITAASKVVKPIPSSEYMRNLKAYRFLLKLAPEDATYLAKVNAYEQKISDQKEKQQLNDIISLISGSDDLDKYRTKMAKAALDLIKKGKCSRKQIKDDNGGWWRSSERKGQYFMDCGRQRVWFDPKSKTGVYADQAISESRASEMCKDAIRGQTLTSPNFHFFDKSYTVHNPRKSVTYVQGFDVQNAFGTKIDYRAYCLIQPSGSLELSLMNK